MSVLAGLTTDKSIVEESDSLGGFSVLDSNIYKMKVELAYITTAASGAIGLACKFVGENKEIFKPTFWMTSGTAKGGKNYYVTKPGTADEKKHYLQGFNQANGMCLLTTGKEVSVMATEKKVINVYDKDAGKEVPTEVDMLTELLGQVINIGILKQLVNKNVKNTNTGKYEPTADTREQNEVDKMFCARTGHEMFTIMEIRAKATEPIFAAKWLEKWEGKVQDKTKKTGVVAGAPSAARQSGAAAPSLFGAEA